MMNTVNTEFFYVEVWFKTAEATGDLIGNKLADKITSIGQSKEKAKYK